MPERKTLERARRDKRQGKSPSTQAGEFVREEIRHARQGRHGARSPRQLIAIGLSKARRSGVKLRPPGNANTSQRTQARAARDYREGQTSTRHQPSRRRSRAVTKALKREGKQSASRAALARQARAAARRRSAAGRSQAARKAVRTKGAAQLKSAARKAARTRSRRRTSQKA